VTRRIEVASAACIGSGQCEAILPTVFEVGDDGVVAVDTEALPSADPRLLSRAVGSCPVSALRLVP
jgi:ferredoxin